MTVGDLLEILKQFPPDLPVVSYDVGTLQGGTLFGVRREGDQVVIAHES